MYLELNAELMLPWKKIADMNETYKPSKHSRKRINNLRDCIRLWYYR